MSVSSMHVMRVMHVTHVGNLLATAVVVVVVVAAMSRTHQKRTHTPHGTRRRTTVHTTALSLLLPRYPIVSNHADMSI